VGGVMLRVSSGSRVYTDLDFLLSRKQKNTKEEDSCFNKRIWADRVRTTWQKALRGGGQA
jgi:hypothetical protein